MIKDVIVKNCVALVDNINLNGIDFKPLRNTWWKLLRKEKLELLIHNGYVLNYNIVGWVDVMNYRKNLK